MDIAVVKANEFCRPGDAPLVGKNGRKYLWPRRSRRGLSIMMVAEEDLDYVLGLARFYLGVRRRIYRRATEEEVRLWGH